MQQESHHPNSLYLTPVRNFPTYAVSYEMSMQSDGTQPKAGQIHFRPLTRDSFLSTALGTYIKPVQDPSLRPCLVLAQQPLAAEQALVDVDPNLTDDDDLRSQREPHSSSTLGQFC